MVWRLFNNVARYACVGNSVRLHMSTDDPSQLPLPFNREYKGLAALGVITAL